MAGPFGHKDNQEHEQVDRLQLAKLILLCNDERNSFIPEHQWGEPSWDILLRVYISQNEKSGFDKVRNPSKMMQHRYVDLLMQQGLLEEISPPNSPDGPTYGLSSQGCKALEDWLDFCAVSKK
ncbi:hypothetical protein [Parasphingorhabdus sp.]